MIKTRSQPPMSPGFRASPSARFDTRRTLARVRVLGLALALVGSLGFTDSCAQVLVQEISPADLSSQQEFGQSIASNATHVAVGSAGDDTKGTNAGAVYVFNLASGVLARKLFAPTADAAAFDQFGVAVAVAGNLVAVGASSGNVGGSDEGAVYLFNLSTGALLQTIIDPAGVTNDKFGDALAMAGDLLVIGKPGHDSPGLLNSGAIFIYNLATGVLTGPILASGLESFAEFGSSVAIEGGLIAVGAPREDDDGNSTENVLDQGAAYLVDAQSGTELHRFTAADGVNSDSFGRSVALARQRLMVGAPGKGTNTGKVYSYDTVNFTEAWTKAGTTTDQRHGDSLAAAGDVVVVGAPRFDFAGASNAGRVQVFQSRDGNLVETLSAPGPGSSDLFGRAVALSGAILLITAEARDNPLLAPGFSQGAFFKCFPIRAPLPFKELAVKGSAPPGAPNTTFLSFNQLAVSPAGFTTFDANVQGSGASLGKTSGIWTNGNPATPNVLQLVRRTGLELLTPRKGTDFSNPVNNADGKLGFTAITSGPDITTLNDKVFAAWDPAGAGLKLPLREGDPPETLNTFQPPRQLHGSDEALFLTQITRRLVGGVTPADDSGLLLFDMTTGLSVLEGAPATSIGSGVNYGQFLPRTAWHGLLLSFAAFLQATAPPSEPPVTTANNLAVFTVNWDTGAETTLGRKGFNAPNTVAGDVGEFSNFLAESNTATKSFFRASVVPSAAFAGRTEGLWSNRTGPVRGLLIKGDPTIAGLPRGVTIKSFLRFAAQGDGTVFVWVLLQGPGVTPANDGAILLSRFLGTETNAVEILLREGLPAPGCGRARVAGIQALDAEINGSYVVLASLTVEAGGAALTDNQALFLGNSLNGSSAQPSRRQPRLMLRKGMQVVRAGSPIVKSIGLPGHTVDASGAMNTGLAHLVTTAGGVPVCSAVVTFNDGQTSVLSIFP